MKTKKIMRRLMGCAAAILALSACSESEDLLAAYHSDSKAVHITAQVGKASADGFTRSNPLGEGDAQKTFNKDDEISVKADEQETVTYQYDGSKWLPQDGKFLKWEKETMNFTAYYPADTYSGGTIIQPSEYTSLKSLADADFMSYSGSQSNTDKSNKLTLTMNRLMARVVVDVVGFNDQYDKDTPIKSVSICGVTAYNHEGKYYALIKTCKAEPTEKFLSLEVGDNKVKETLTGIPTLEAGKSYTYELTVGKNKISVSGITVADWNTGTITDDGKAEIIPYVTFTAEAEQAFKMTTNGDYIISGLQYSVNFGEWQDVVKDIPVTFGGTHGDLRLRGTNTNGTANNANDYSTITFTNNVSVACTGDIRTLLNYKEYKSVETGNAKFCSLVYGCAVLTSAPDLPATTLAEYCYYGMFYECTVLTSAPDLPATTLAEFCYGNMFNRCTNLKSAPKMPATKLAEKCYWGMFAWSGTLSSVTMLAPSTQIASYNYSLYFWLEQAGTRKSVTSRTLKVKNADAYNALIDKGLLPEKWKKGAEGTTVLNENDKKIE